MKQIGIFILLFLGLFGCEDNIMWVGNSEYVTISYSNSTGGGPVVEDLYLRQSPFAKYDTAWAASIGQGKVQVILDGVRIQGTESSFELKSVSIYEDEEGKFEVKNSGTDLATTKKSDIAVVLVLNLNASLGESLSTIKNYGKNFVDQMVANTDNSKVAVVLFAGKDDIYTSNFYDHTNVNLLKAAIDNYSSDQSKSALFEAAHQGIALLDSLVFEGSKSLVVFSNSGDTDSNNPTVLQEEIAVSPYQRIIIGLDGDDYKREDLLAIADVSANCIRVNQKEHLEVVFNGVCRQVVSVYKVIYERPDEILEKTISIKFEFGVERLN